MNGIMKNMHLPSMIYPIFDSSIFLLLESALKEDDGAVTTKIDKICL